MDDSAVHNPSADSHSNYEHSGFGLTIGSDLYFILDPHARAAQLAATAGLSQIVVQGTFAASNSTAFAGSFTFSNSTYDSSIDTSSAPGDVCFRDPSWPWYLQPFPLWSLALLVPAFSTFSSAANGQPFRSKQLPVMVAISCASFAGKHQSFKSSRLK